VLDFGSQKNCLASGYRQRGPMTVARDSISRGFKEGLAGPSTGSTAFVTCI